MSDLIDDNDTIAAIATGSGAGGIGIVRLSGPDAVRISKALTGKTPAPRQAQFAAIRDTQGELLDHGLLILFAAPHSFTGQDVAELQCHGGPVLLRTVLRECLACGARQAEPGEFSQRAFLNNKIDLVQAEAIADLINSSTEAAARSASRSLSGKFSARVNAVLEQLVRLRVFIEAAIDFPEEEIDFIGESDVLQRIDQLQNTLQELLDSAKRGRTLRDGMKLVIAGATNAGKSSLLNQLAEQDTAIVTDIPGTTRDVLHEYIHIDGLPLHIVDTAGLRESTDIVEREGIRRAHSEILSADRVLLVIDNSHPDPKLRASDVIAQYAEYLPPGIGVTVIWNKCDLNKHAPLALVPAPVDASIRGANSITEIHLSAHTGAGIDLLREHLLACAGMDDSDGSDFSARERHVIALQDCAEHLRQGRSQLHEHGAAELIAEDLRYAQDSLGKITGEFGSDALLGEIFSSFCIGK